VVHAVHMQLIMRFVQLHTGDHHPSCSLSLLHTINYSCNVMPSCIFMHSDTPLPVACIHAWPPAPTFSPTHKPSLCYLCKLHLHTFIHCVDRRYYNVHAVRAYPASEWLLCCQSNNQCVCIDGIRFCRCSLVLLYQIESHW
jgi:hypothetical protein